MPTAAAANWLTQKAPTTQVVDHPVLALMVGASTGNA
jgi:hypothetical protein